MKEREKMTGLKKKWMATFVVCMMTLLMALLSGCGDKLTPADQIAGAFFKLYVLNDAEDAKNIIGFSEEEISEIKDNHKNSLIEGYRKIMSSFQYEVTQEELNSMYEAMMTAFSKITFTSKTTQKKGNKATVTITTDWIDVNSISDQVGEAAEAAVGGNVTEENVNDYLKNYMIEFEKAFSTATPNTDQKTIELEFQKTILEFTDGSKKKLWYPNDHSKMYEEFLSTVQGV